MDIGSVMNLIEKGSLLPYENKYYVLFSKSGFTDAVTAFVKNHPEMLCFELNQILA